MTRPRWSQDPGLIPTDEVYTFYRESCGHNPVKREGGRQSIQNSSSAQEYAVLVESRMSYHKVVSSPQTDGQIRCDSAGPEWARSPPLGPGLPWCFPAAERPAPSLGSRRPELSRASVITTRIPWILLLEVETSVEPTYGPDSPSQEGPTPRH